MVKFAVLLLAVALSACSGSLRDPFVAYQGDYMGVSVTPQNQNPASGNFYFPNLKL